MLHTSKKEINYIYDMKTADLTKGQKVQSSILGVCRVLSITKKYIRLEQLDFGNIVCKQYYQSPDDDIKSLTSIQNT